MTLLRIITVVLAGLLSQLALACVSASADVPAANNADAIVLLQQLQPQRGVAMPFTEQRASALLAQPLELGGHVELDLDGNLIKQINTPFTERIVIGKDYAQWSRDGNTRRISTNGRAGRYLGALRQLLNGDAAALRQTFDLSASNDAPGWQVQLVPKRQAMRRRVRQITISGIGTQLQLLRTDQDDHTWQVLRFQPAAAP